MNHFDYKVMLCFNFPFIRRLILRSLFWTCLLFYFSVPIWALILIAAGAILFFLCCCYCVCKRCICKKRKKKEGKKGLKGPVDLKAVQLIGASLKKEKVSVWLVSVTLYLFLCSGSPHVGADCYRSGLSPGVVVLLLLYM